MALDIVYLFCHSRHGDEEIRYSLRSVAAHLGWVRKVWIFGDRPEWLSEDRALVEHVPHGYMTPLLHSRIYKPVHAAVRGVNFLCGIFDELVASSA